MTRHRGAWLALPLLAAAALAGCAGGEPPTGVANIPMLDNFYARDVTRVPVGGTVRFPTRAGCRTTRSPWTAAGGPRRRSGGLVWTGVRGYRASYVTASNDKDHT